MVSDKLALLKAKLEQLNPPNDDVLQSYLDDAESFLLSETNRVQLNDPLNLIVVDVAYHDCLIDNQFAETSRSEGGVSVSYDKNYPPRILKIINNNIQLKAVKIANENRQEENVLLKTKMPYRR